MSAIQKTTWIFKLKCNRIFFLKLEEPMQVRVCSDSSLIRTCNLGIKKLEMMIWNFFILEFFFYLSMVKWFIYLSLHFLIVCTLLYFLLLPSSTISWNCWNTDLPFFLFRAAAFLRFLFSLSKLKLRLKIKLFHTFNVASPHLTHPARCILYSFLK